jgi:hypothetical protein
MWLSKGQVAGTGTGFSVSNLAFPVSIPPMLHNYSFVSHFVYFLQLAASLINILKTSIYNILLVSTNHAGCCLK